MHRPLRIPLYIRIWHLIKGILFYNTVYWEKASDGLNMPSLSREERENRRPKADLEIIRPREKPRSRLDNVRASQIAKPGQYTQVSEPLPVPMQMPEPAEMEALFAAAARKDGKYVKRRRYKRRQSSSTTGGHGFFHRVFGRKDE